MDLKTVVDRSTYVVLKGQASTPSSSAQDTEASALSTELLHRLHGTSLLYQASILLKTSSSVYATSTTIFHRFFHREPLQKYDVWSTSMACTLLACKTHEDVRKLKDIILTYVHLYRRFRLGYVCKDEDEEKSKSSSPRDDNSDELCTNTNKFFQTSMAPILSRSSNSMSNEEKQNRLRYIRPMSETGPVYKAWEEALTKMENVILRTLGFTLYFIPDSHPHGFLMYFLKVLEVEEGKVVQTAWNYCNDSCRLDLCVRFDPEIITCSAILLACIDCGIQLPMSTRPWWHVFVGQGRDGDLSTACNALLGLGDTNFDKRYQEAMQIYVVSLIDSGGSFNDPSSFLWNIYDS